MGQLVEFFTHLTNYDYFKIRFFCTMINNVGMTIFKGRYLVLLLVSVFEIKHEN